MEFIPAIDLLGGKCVRLFQGDYGQKTDYSDHPLEVARDFINQGARRIHLVDLDGAKEGSPVNQGIVRQMVATFPDVTFEIGGGIRSQEGVATYLNLGVKKVILGSKAVQEPDFLLAMEEQYPQRIVLGLDTKGDYIATHGWRQTSQWQITNFLTRLARDNCTPEIIFTDIRTDGTLEGPPVTKLEELAQSYPDNRFIASGGVATLAHVQAILDLPVDNIVGIISGKAIYEKKLSVEQAVSLCRLK